MRGGTLSLPIRPLTKVDPHQPQRQSDMYLLIAVALFTRPLRCQKDGEKLHGLVSPLSKTLCLDVPPMLPADPVFRPLAGPIQPHVANVAYN